MAAESPAWRKSLASEAADNCVEIATDEQSVLVRDSRDRSGAILVVAPDNWREFLTRIRNGEISPGGDLP